LIAAAGIVVAGCGAQAGPSTAGSGRPMAVATSGATSLTSAAATRAAPQHAASPTSMAARRAASRRVASPTSAAARRDAPEHASPRHGSPRAVQRTPAVPANAPHGVELTPTPAAPRRPRTPQRSRPVALAHAERLGAPACATYADALAGRFTDVVAARGSRRALALVTESVAAALLGLPVLAPQASLPARERLDAVLGRLSAALATADDGAATATAIAMTPRIRAYAAALRIGACA
jgi:hypothetical protein